ncbi:MAG: phospho-N-acetylmuramoyl-pentapeptide-transferase [Sulfobacillus thermotolerans]|nr:phospho-N-acetylmuramoyl-pentapeptide-transferase [Sulfobacillus thermotolerans]
MLPFQIRLLRSLALVQPIRAELPPDQQTKQGRPLMGGTVFLLGMLVSVMASATRISYFLAIVFAAFSVIGFLDDAKKALYKDPDGISGRTKMLLQFVVAGASLYYLYRHAWIDFSVPIFKTYAAHLGPIVFGVGALLLIVGSTNAINFTDGLDGLLSSVAIPNYLFFFMIAHNFGVQLFCLIMVACLVGFLMFNAYPAKLVMGDTGSMAIGGSLILLAVMEKVEILVPILFVIYFAEILSVMIQVSYFKRTGKRIFRMTPIHYHFGLRYGWNEKRVVAFLTLVSWASMVVCLGYYHFFL